VITFIEGKHYAFQMKCIRKNIGYLVDRNWGAENRKKIEIGNMHELEELDVKFLVQYESHLLVKGFGGISEGTKYYRKFFYSPL
jgi:hypothetical protein